VLSLNMFMPSLPGIAEAFGVDYGLASLSLAGYLATTAVMQLIIGPMSDRFGRRPVLLVGVSVFALASLGCVFADDIWTFLAFRVLQSAIIAGWVLSLAIIRDTTPTEETASRIGYLTMVMAVGPMLGPLLGGSLDQLFGWRANFVAYFLFSLIVLGLVWFDAGETNRYRSGTFSSQFRDYPALFRSRRFWGYSLCTVFSSGTFYVFIAGAPLVAHATFGMSPATLGFYIGTITVGFALGSFLSGRYAGRFPYTTMMITGRSVASAGLLTGLLLFFAGHGSVLALFGATIFSGFGNGLTTPSSNAGTLSVRPQLAGSAAGLAGAMMVTGGALLTSFTGAVLSVTHGPYQLLGIMLVCALVGLVAALYVRHVDRRENPGGNDRLN